MCGRVRLASDYSEIKIRLRFGSDIQAPNLEPNWNMPPTSRMLIARSEGGRRIPEAAKWGLLPPFAKDQKMAFSTFNARAEGLPAKPMFRNAWNRGQRCLVVVDGFYEWKKLSPDGKLKQPYAIALTSSPIMTMAGLWDTWTDKASGETVRSCTIITTTPNDTMAQIHDRMPVILEEDAWGRWLGEDPSGADELQAMLAPCPSEWLTMWPVSKDVGNVRNKGPELAESLDLGQRS